MPTVYAYTDGRHCEDLCPTCAHTRYPDLAVGELDHVVPVYEWELGQYDDYGLSCCQCGAKLYTPADLETLDSPTIFTPSPEVLETIGEWYNGQYSMSYAVVSTGALTVNLAPKTYRQAYTMLTDLIRELVTCRDYPSTSAADYIALDRAVDEVTDARLDYRR